MRYLTTSRVAHELILSEAAVRKLADAGVLPVVAKLSDGTRLFDPDAVMAYAAQRRDLEGTRHSAEHARFGRSTPSTTPSRTPDAGSTNPPDDHGDAQ